MTHDLRSSAESEKMAKVQSPIVGLEIVGSESKDRGVPIFRVYMIEGWALEREPVQVGQLAYQSGIAKWVFTAV